MTETIKPFDSGNWFPIHNYVFDVCMPMLSNAAWRVLCVAIRSTQGWYDDEDPTHRKEWDEISYSQFRQKAGLASSSSVSKGIRECLKFKYLIRRQIGIRAGIGSPIYAYALNRGYKAIIPSTVSVPIDAEHKIPGTESVPIAQDTGTENEAMEDATGTLFGHTKVNKGKLKKDERKEDLSFSKEETNKEFLGLWEPVLEELKLQMTGATFNTWLGTSKLIAADNSTWTVKVHEPAVEWLTNRLMPVIERTVQRHAPGVTVEFVA